MGAEAFELELATLAASGEIGQKNISFHSIREVKV
jgi:hypothetical protein